MDEKGVYGLMIFVGLCCPRAVVVVYGVFIFAAYMLLPAETGRWSRPCKDKDGSPESIWFRCNCCCNSRYCCCCADDIVSVPVACVHGKRKAA